MYGLVGWRLPISGSTGSLWFGGRVYDNDWFIPNQQVIVCCFLRGFLAQNLRSWLLRPVLVQLRCVSSLSWLRLDRSFGNRAKGHSQSSRSSPPTVSQWLLVGYTPWNKHSQWSFKKCHLNGKVANLSAPFRPLFFCLLSIWGRADRAGFSFDPFSHTFHRRGQVASHFGALCNDIQTFWNTMTYCKCVCIR